MRNLPPTVSEIQNIDVKGTTYDAIAFFRPLSKKLALFELKSNICLPLVSTEAQKNFAKLCQFEIKNVEEIKDPERYLNLDLIHNGHFQK